MNKSDHTKLPRETIKVAEPVHKELQEKKPDGMSWTTWLQEKCLFENQEG